MAVSVYISNTQLHVTVGSGSAKKVRVRRAYRLRLSEGSIINGVITNEEQLRDELMSIWKEYRLPRKNIQLIIDSGKIMSKVLQVPYMKEKELLSYIRMEFSEGQREDQVIDYMPMAKDGPYDLNRIFCAAVEKNVIDSYLSLFQDMRLKIKRISIGMACLIKTAMATGYFQDRTGILMILEENSVTSVLFENGRYLYSRRNRLIHDIHTPQGVEELERIADGIRQFFMQRHSEHRLTTLYLSGEQEGTAQRLDERMQPYEIQARTVETLNRVKFPAMEMHEKGMVPAVPGAFLYCIGALIK